MLEDSSDRVEYQLNAIRSKYDLKVDEQKIRYVHEAAELLCTLDSSVKREVYGGRVADSAGISMEAMKLEIGKAFKKRMSREKKQQEKIDLAPAQALQPKSRSIRYENMKSAMAEEAVLAMVLKAPALLDQTKDLHSSAFSSALLGKVFAQLKQRHDSGLEVSLAVVEDCTAEEMSHLTGILQRQQGPANESALADCIRTILAQHQKAGVTTEEDLLAIRNRLKERKGIQ